MTTFTQVFERDGDWWIGSVEELPGANTQERTLEEAIQLILEVSHELANDDQVY